MKKSKSRRWNRDESKVEVKEMRTKGGRGG